MEIQERTYDAEAGQISIRCSYNKAVEVGDLLTVPLKDRGIVDLSVYTRHFENMGRGLRIFEPGIVRDPYIDVSIEKVSGGYGNNSSGVAQVVIKTAAKANEEQVEQGKLTVQEIAKVFGLVQ